MLVLQLGITTLRSVLSFVQRSLSVRFGFFPCGIVFVYSSPHWCSYLLPVEFLLQSLQVVVGNRGQ